MVPKPEEAMLCWEASPNLHVIRLVDHVSLALHIGIRQHLQSILECLMVYKYAHGSATCVYLLKYMYLGGGGTTNCTVTCILVHLYSLQMSVVQLADVQVRHDF